jgi:hypothetical protein
MGDIQLISLLLSPTLTVREARRLLRPVRRDTKIQRLSSSIEYPSNYSEHQWIRLPANRNKNTESPSTRSER